MTGDLSLVNVLRTYPRSYLSIYLHTCTYIILHTYISSIHDTPKGHWICNIVNLRIILQNLIVFKCTPDSSLQWQYHPPSPHSHSFVHKQHLPTEQLKTKHVPDVTVCSLCPATPFFQNSLIRAVSLRVVSSLHPHTPECYSGGRNASIVVLQHKRPSTPPPKLFIIFGFSLFKGARNARAALCSSVGAALNKANRAHC